MKDEKSAPFCMPSETDDANYQRESRKLEELAGALDAARQEFAAAELRLAKQGSGDPEKVSIAGRVISRAAAMVGGFAVPERKPSTRDEDIRRLAELSGKVAALAEAVSVQTVFADAARERAQEQIGRAAKPEHDRRAKEICTRLIALHAAVLEYDAFWHALPSGAGSGMVNLGFGALGAADSRYSAWADFLHVAARKGFITKAEIPAQLKLAPGQIP